MRHVAHEFDMLDLEKSCLSFSTGGKVEACLKDEKKDPLGVGGGVE